jgi:hypothetical protein
MLKFKASTKLEFCLVQRLTVYGGGSDLHEATAPHFAFFETIGNYKRQGRRRRRRRASFFSDSLLLSFFFFFFLLC